jgi:hypothetical protein
MKRFAFIPLLTTIWFSGIAQESFLQKVPKLTVDDKTGGYTICTYTVPTEGFYVFTVDGGLLPKNSCTIYYCEYELHLKSLNRSYKQQTLNIASQAQDGNVCHFNTNDKNNKVSGVFAKDEVVELRLVLLKSDVNGQPHKQLALTENTLVSVKQVTPGYQSE